MNWKVYDKSASSKRKVFIYKELYGFLDEGNLENALEEETIFSFSFEIFKLQFLFHS